MSDKSKEKESIKQLEEVKSNTCDQKLKEKVDNKLQYISKPLNK